MIEQMLCRPNFPFPNNSILPVCLLREVFTGEGEKLAIALEHAFMANQWPPAWRNGLYDFHHFHSTAHEALGVYSGWVKACFGGPGGAVLTASAGDVIVIPAGVSHQNLAQSQDFKVVGGYPEGQYADMRYGDPAEYEHAADQVQSVPLPSADPVFGEGGPLIGLWASIGQSQKNMD